MVNNQEIRRHNYETKIVIIRQPVKILRDKDRNIKELKLEDRNNDEKNKRHNCEILENNSPNCSLPHNFSCSVILLYSEDQFKCGENTSVHQMKYEHHQALILLIQFGQHLALAHLLSYISTFQIIIQTFQLIIMFFKSHNSNPRLFFLTIFTFHNYDFISQKFDLILHNFDFLSCNFDFLFHD